MRYCVHYIFKNSKVLLLKRKLSNPFYPGIWTPVVGKIKTDEHPSLAVVRETQEETNLKIDNPKFVNHCMYDGDEYWFYHSISLENDITLNHENEQFDFFKRDNLPPNLWSFFKAELDKI